MYQTKKPKIWRWILLGLLIIIVRIVFIGGNFSYNKTITIKQGDTFQTLLKDFSWKQKIRIKWYVRHHDIDFSNLTMGSYVFSGEYSPASFVQFVQEWPKFQYTTIKILEGWSMYDIDNALSNKWYLTTGAYIQFISNPALISTYQTKYSFLKWLQLKSLEGFLYPDTYKVDKEKDLLDQLIYLQLEAFKKRVWKDAEGIVGISPLSWYDSIKLASIVEKEERSTVNRPTVAGILIKRLKMGTLIGADISLCYFFEKPYSECKPAFISQHIQDNNPYNTRVVKGLPPTPVSNPSASSIMSVLQPQQSDYFYYLHDMNGSIHYGKTLDEHNQNRNMYLK